MCRIKQYPALVSECSLIWNYLTVPFGFGPEKSERKNGRLGLIQKALKPIMWTLFYDEHERAMVDNYTGHEQCHFYY